MGRVLLKSGSLEATVLRERPVRLSSGIVERRFQDSVGLYAGKQLRRTTHQ
jgi:hypothetical protein